MANSLIKRIIIDPEVCHGKPTIRGSRLMVSTILELLASEMTMDEILSDYPALEKEDIFACFQYAAMLAKFQSLPIAA